MRARAPWLVLPNPLALVPAFSACLMALRLRFPPLPPLPPCLQVDCPVAWTLPCLLQQCPLPALVQQGPVALPAPGGGVVRLVAVADPALQYSHRAVISLP